MKKCFFFWNKINSRFRNRKHCSDLQWIVGVDSATSKIEHGIQERRAKMLQTQNQGQNLNQRFPNSKTNPQKWENRVLQNRFFFPPSSAIEHIGNQENLICFCSCSSF